MCRVAASGVTIIQHLHAGPHGLFGFNFPFISCKFGQPPQSVKCPSKGHPFKMPLTSRSKQQQPAAAARYSITPDLPDSPSPRAPPSVDEFSDVEWTFYLWCGLSCLVAGLVDGASLAGVYQEATSHLSGVSTKLALRLHIAPPHLSTALASNLGVSMPYWGYFTLVCTFGLGSLICGFVLVDRGAHDEQRPYIMNVALGPALHPKHRILIATSALLLSFSSLVIRCLESGVCFFGPCSSPDATFAQMLLSMMLASCTCGMLNGLTSSSKVFIFRASHMTGTVTDVFLLVGYSIRTGALPRPQLTRLVVSGSVVHPSTNSVIAKLALLLLQVLIMSWVCFVSGGYFGAVTPPHLHSSLTLAVCLTRATLFRRGVFLHLRGSQRHDRSHVSAVQALSHILRVNSSGA